MKLLVPSPGKLKKKRKKIYTDSRKLINLFEKKTIGYPIIQWAIFFTNLVIIFRNYYHAK